MYYIKSTCSRRYFLCGGKIYIFTIVKSDFEHLGSYICIAHFEVTGWRLVFVSPRGAKFLSTERANHVRAVLHILLLL